MKILFNYLDQNQRCNSRLDIFETQLRASTTTGSNRISWRSFGYPAPALSVDRRVDSVEAVAHNPEHLTDSSARSRKVAWSCRPLAAVYSGIAIRRIHLGP